MRKQHGVLFESPRCEVCGAEMDLHRLDNELWYFMCPAYDRMEHDAENKVCCIWRAQPGKDFPIECLWE